MLQMVVTLKETVPIETLSVFFPQLLNLNLIVINKAVAN